MGHADAVMAGVYRERIEDDRLVAVTESRSQVAVSRNEEQVEFKLPGVGSSHDRPRCFRHHGAHRPVARLERWCMMDDESDNSAVEPTNAERA